jgi:ribosomal protein L7/L12
MDLWLPMLDIVVLVVLVLMSFTSARTPTLDRRLARIERRLALVMRRLEIEDPDSPVPGVVEQLEQGKKIQAIKVYREQTGAGLAEAKTAVEAIARERGL